MTKFALSTIIVFDLPKGPVSVRAWVDSCADTDFVLRRFLDRMGITLTTRCLHHASL